MRCKSNRKGRPHSSLKESWSKNFHILNGVNWNRGLFLSLDSNLVLLYPLTNRPRLVHPRSFFAWIRRVGSFAELPPFLFSYLTEVFGIAALQSFNRKQGPGDLAGRLPSHCRKKKELKDMRKKTRISPFFLSLPLTPPSSTTKHQMLEDRPPPLKNKRKGLVNALESSV